MSDVVYMGLLNAFFWGGIGIRGTTILLEAINKHNDCCCLGSSMSFYWISLAGTILLFAGMIMFLLIASPVLGSGGK
jgi:hypothetical protein